MTKMMGDGLRVEHGLCCFLMSLMWLRNDYYPLVLMERNNLPFHLVHSAVSSAEMTPITP